MIIIPMMGKSSRFFNDGYTVPKYELPLAGATVFDWVLKSFQDYFDSEKFVFVVRSDFGARTFVEERIRGAGIAESEVLELDGNTRGQADTVYLALARPELSQWKSEPLSIFNADSFLTSFEMPSPDVVGDGLIEVFRGEGEHWSFVEPGPERSVVRTTEKIRVSDLCSDGYYYFSTVDTFTDSFSRMESTNDTVNGELYVAPMYNHVLALGGSVSYRIIGEEQCVFCGVPDEYEALLASGWVGFGG